MSGSILVAVNVYFCIVANPRSQKFENFGHEKVKFNRDEFSNWSPPGSLEADKSTNNLVSLAVLIIHPNRLNTISNSKGQRTSKMSIRITGLRSFPRR